MFNSNIHVNVTDYRQLNAVTVEFKTWHLAVTCIQTLFQLTGRIKLMSYYRHNTETTSCTNSE